MKTANILKASLLMGVVVAVSSCTEEKIYGIDPNGIPQASDYAIKVDVDQSTNQVNLTLTDKSGNPAKAVYPVWKVYTKANPVMSTRPVYSDIITVAGDYDVEVQVANHHGISDGVQTASIHIENTMVDFTPYIKNLTDNSAKVWQIAANEQGHLGCGTPGGEGLDWWSAVPYDKKDWGVYDNRMTFTDNGGNSTGLYTYDPGASGTIYINKEITDLDPYSAYNPNDDNDYCAPAEKQETTFTLSPEGTDLYLVFPAGTLLGYLPNMDAYNNPKFKVYSITKNKIELSIDNGGIAWHYIFKPEGADAGDKPFEGFKYNSEFNLWKDAPIYLAETFFADGGWSMIDQPEIELSNERIFFHTPAGMGNDQWQGQVKINSGIIVSSENTYDFSMYLNAPVDCDITVKPHLLGDDGVFFVADKQHFDAGGSYYYFSDVKGFDGEVQLVLDFGGYPDIDIEIKNIVLKDHANDDGTVLPNEGGDDEDPAVAVDWVAVDSPDNLYNQIEGDVEVSFWYAPGWNQIADPDLTREGNRSFSFTLPEATSDQWQAQFNYKTGINIDPEKFYDVKCIVISDKDFNGVTFKLTHEQMKEDGSGTEDVGEFAMSREAVEAYEEHIFSYVNVPGIPTDNLKVVFDFGGNPANTNIIIKDIIIQEHRGPKELTWVGVDSDENLYKAANIESMEAWTADNSWTEIERPEIIQNGNNYFELVYSVSPGTNQWQAQFQYKTDLSFPDDKTYDFRVTINPTCDIAGATIKPCDAIDEDNIYWDTKRVDLEAYEDNIVILEGVHAPISVFKMAFDFAGVQAGDKIIIKDIIIQEHK